VPLRFAFFAAGRLSFQSVVSKTSVSLARNRNLLRKLQKVTRDISSSTSPKAVHDLRTTARRIETLLSAYGLDDHGYTSKFAKQLAKLRRRAGKLRDADVHIEALKSIRLDNSSRERTALHDRLATLRNKRKKKLLRTFDKEMSNGLPKRIKRASKDLAVPPKDSSRKNHTAEALEKFKALVSKYPPLTEKTLHNFRIECKRIRYIAEMDGNRLQTKRVVAALKRIQDAIGTWHDWLTLTQTAGEVVPNTASSLLAALRAQTRSKFNEALQVSAEAKQELLILCSAATPASSARRPLRTIRGTGRGLSIIGGNKLREQLKAGGIAA
jgi:CHAD domain-containing protein